MKVKVFVSESRVTRKAYTEDMKPRERLAYLKKFPRSSFKKITDEKGKIVEAGAKKPQNKKRNLSGKPRAPKSSAPARKRRNPVSQRLKKQALSNVSSPRARKSVEAAIEKINSGAATKRNLATIKKHVDEDTAASFEKAFNTSRKRAKENVETRRKDISTPSKPTRRKPVKKSNTEKPPKKRTAKKPVKKSQPAKKQSAPEEKPAEKPTTRDAAQAIQKLPKQHRASLLESAKRVFSKKATDADLAKIDKAKRRVGDKTSRETLDKLKRYAEAGVIGKKKPAKPSPATRKKLTKMELYDRIKETELPKVTAYRDKAKDLEVEFRKKAEEIRDGKGTRDERISKIRRLRKKYQTRIDRQLELAKKKSTSIRKKISEIRDQSDRADGERKKKK